MTQIVAPLATFVTARTFASNVLLNPFTHIMYGLIGKIAATPGQRDALVAILIEGTAKMRVA